MQYLNSIYVSKTSMIGAKSFVLFDLGCKINLQQKLTLSTSLPCSYANTTIISIQHGASFMLAADL